MADKVAFAGYPSAVLYQADGPDQPPKQKKPVQHLLWGDHMTLKKERGDFHWARSRGKEGWVRKDAVQQERILEVVFVDVGQGDGALVVTPDDKHMVIDAGVSDNMYRFLRWRFGRFAQPFEFESAILSHPDSDHYAGFDSLFDDPNVTFATVYHNGIMERKGENPLGRRKKVGRRSYLVELVENRSGLEKFLSVASRWKRKKFPTMIEKGLRTGRFQSYERLSASRGFLPGYGADDRVTIEVLGPVEEPVGSGSGLRYLGSVGKTKNGHSVVLRLVLGDVRILLGGDLNIPAEELLLSHHTGLAGHPSSVEEERLLVEAARPFFEVEVAKSCHHGSSDFSESYLKATNSLVTVVSSGDNEPHAHPRSDTLGALGRWGRGARPLVFSTELARSTKESVKSPFELRRRLREAEVRKDDPTLTQSQRDKAQRDFDRMVDKIDRSVAVYGAINLRSDGEKVVMAYKIEAPRKKDRKWDIYRLEKQGNGPLRYVSKH